jgi:hypothetical protein
MTCFNWDRAIMFSSRFHSRTHHFWHIAFMYGEGD